MELFTLDVGQGAFSILVGKREAIVFDTHVPSSGLTLERELSHIKTTLTDVLTNKELVGLVVKGFDADHFNEKGLKIVMNKYRPKWIIYPKYYKKTANADSCFRFITEFTKVNKQFERIPAAVEKANMRWICDLTEEWNFEFFNPFQGSDLRYFKMLWMRTYPPVEFSI